RGAWVESHDVSATALGDWSSRSFAQIWNRYTPKPNNRCRFGVPPPLSGPELMNVVAENSAASPAPLTPEPMPASRWEALPPVTRPGKSGWQLFKEVLDHGGPGYLQFAITNICN